MWQTFLSRSCLACMLAFVTSSAQAAEKPTPIVRYATAATSTRSAATSAAPVQKSCTHKAPCWCPDTYRPKCPPRTCPPKLCGGGCYTPKCEPCVRIPKLCGGGGCYVRKCPPAVHPPTCTSVSGSNYWGLKFERWLLIPNGRCAPEWHIHPSRSSDWYAASGLLFHGYRGSTSMTAPGPK